MENKKQFNQVMNSMKSSINEFPWENKQAYGEWIAQTYYFVLHSTRLFASAASRCELKNNALQFHLLEHLAEEKGHENLAVNDLKALGLSVDDIPELPETSSLYQIQYYWIEHKSPAAFFGYLMCLEGLAVEVGPSIYDRTSQAFGKKACSFFRVHISEDKDHLAEVFEQLEKFNEKHIKDAFKNLEQSANLYINMLNHIRIRVRDASNNIAA